MKPVNDFIYTLALITGLLPLLRVYLFMLDYVKDIFLLIFVKYRTDFLNNEFLWMIHYTVYAQAISIALAASVVGLNFAPKSP